MLDKKIIGKYKACLKDNLSKKRYVHSVNVAVSALELARLYKCDEDRAYVAGLLHDVAKELDTKKQLELVNSSQLAVCDIEKQATPLFHAVAGAELVKILFDIKDDEIIWAIRYHTVAGGDMTSLAMIIYLADLISADRDYKDVKRMRKIAGQGLETAMLEALKFSIKDSVEKGNTIPLSTLEAYNRFINETKSKLKGMTK